MPVRRRSRSAVRWATFAGALAPLGATASASDPPWLRFGEGTLALVDIAPWKSRSPIAALTADESSAAGLSEQAALEPDDVVRRPPGFLVRVRRALDDGVVLVSGTTGDGPREAYTILDRLQPRVPAGTALVTAGGFAGYAFLYPTLDAAQDRAFELETGTAVTAGETAAGGVRGETADFVRLHVRVRSGPLRGREGWIAVGYVGLPRPPGFGATPAERQCHCRIAEFREPAVP